MTLRLGLVYTNPTKATYIHSHIPKPNRSTNCTTVRHSSPLPHLQPCSTPYSLSLYYATVHCCPGDSGERANLSVVGRFTPTE